MTGDTGRPGDAEAEDHPETRITITVATNGPTTHVHAQVPALKSYFLSLERAVRNNDKSAFNSCFSQLYPILDRLFSKWIERICGRTFSAEDQRDIVHDALERLIKALAAGTTVDGWSAWSHRMVYNICLDRMRERRQQTAIDMVMRKDAEELAPHAQPLEQSVINRDLAQRILTMAPLTAQRRKVVLLAYSTGLSTPSVAAALGVNPQTVRVHLSLARRQLTKTADDLERGDLAAIGRYADATKLPPAVRPPNEKLVSTRLEPGLLEPGQIETGRSETGRSETGRSETGRSETGEPGAPNRADTRHRSRAKPHEKTSAPHEKTSASGEQP